LAPNRFEIPPSAKRSANLSSRFVMKRPTRKHVAQVTLEIASRSFGLRACFIEQRPGKNDREKAVAETLVRWGHDHSQSGDDVSNNGVRRERPCLSERTRHRLH